MESEINNKPKLKSTPPNLLMRTHQYYAFPINWKSIEASKDIMPRKNFDFLCSGFEQHNHCAVDDFDDHSNAVAVEGFDIYKNHAYDLAGDLASDGGHNWCTIL